MASRGQVSIRFGAANGGKDAWDYIKTLDTQSRQFFYEAIDELGKVGEDEMRKKIERTPSEHSTTGVKRLLGFNQGGRIRTGDMYRSVSSRPRRGDKIYTTEVGYLKNQQDYYKYQENGFWQVWKFVRAIMRPYSTAPNAPAGFLFEKKERRTWVKGIFALKDARQKIEDESPRVWAKVDRRIDRWLNKQ